jgi:Cu(I)/Ag(I) efflux system membrane fusion protein
MYAAYFEVQKSLAADQAPPAAAAQALASTAHVLSGDNSLPESQRKLFQETATQAEHLHHMDLVDARKAFKPISHAVVTLATQIRSEQAQQPFTHFYCPMVPGGNGDWLQAGGELLNPYFGSQMLKCGEKVAEYPANSKTTPQSDSHEQHDAALKKSKTT